MSDSEQITFEGTKYGGIIKIKAASTGMGEEKKLPKGAPVAFVGRGSVLAVSFKEAGGINVREHTTSADEVQVVPEEVVADIVEELRELETGQPRLLSVDGESRRAARAAVRERVNQIVKGYTPEDDDGQGVDHFVRAACVDERIAAIDADADAFDSPEDYYAHLEEQYVVIAAVALAGVESMHRRRCQAIEDARAAKETAEREAARAAAEAAAVSSDDVADSEAADLNRDDGAVVLADAIDEVIEEVAPDAEDGPVHTTAEQDAALEANDADELERRAAAEGDNERMATDAQRVALSKQIMAMSGNEAMTREWIEWCDGHGIPQHPSEMTFEQARKALVFVGDAENAEAGG